MSGYDPYRQINHTNFRNSSYEVNSYILPPNFSTNEVVFDRIKVNNIIVLTGASGVIDNQTPYGATGPQGQIGSQGNVGPQGSPGLRGNTGSQGPTGAQGPAGFSTNTGAQGPQGNQGPTGSVGPIGFGLRGATGATGSTGYTGYTGPQGQVGQQGVPGPVGSQGNQGPQGPQGPQGAQGIRGIDGVTGSQGPQGIRGIDGVTGSQGPIGPQGNQGRAGAQGPQGEIGPQGIQGPTGSAGGLINVTQLINNISAGSTLTNTTITPWRTTYNSLGGTLVCNLSFSGFSTTVGLYNFQFLVDSIVFATSSFYFNSTNTHHTIPCMFNIGTLSSGAHTFDIKIPNGAYVDGSDFAHLTVTEYIGANTIGLTGSTGPTQWQTQSVGKIYYTGTNVGIGTGAPQNALDVVGNMKVTGNIIQPTLLSWMESSFSQTVSTTTYSLDCNTGNNFILTLTTNSTLSFINPPTTGKVFGLNLIIVQDATGNRTITWPASVSWGSVGAPTLSTAANSIDIISFVTYNGGTKYLGFLSGKGF